MLTIELAIVDRDKAYQNALTKFLITYQPITFLIHCFNDLESIHDFLNQHPKTMCLMDYHSLVDYIQSYRISDTKYFCIMVEDLLDDSIHHLQSHYHLINKYNKGGLIALKISQYFTDITPKEFSRVCSDGLRLITMTQMNSIEESFSHLFANYIQKFQKKILFLSFDALSSPPKNFEIVTNNSMTDLIFYLKKDSRKLAMMIEKIKSSDQTGYFDYIPNCQLASHYWMLDTQLIETFVTYIKEFLSYDVVIIELDNSYSLLNLKWMELSHHNLLVLSEHSSSIKRAANFLKQSEVSQLSNITTVMYGESTEDTKDLTIFGDVEYTFPYDNNNDDNNPIICNLFKALVNEVIK